MTDTAGSRNDGTVDRLLREAGFDDDAVLQAALEGLRGLAAEQPQASAAVAALMAPPVARAGAAQPATGSPAAAIDELAARRRAKRRITLTTLSLAASLAAGGAVAVASDQGVRDSIGQLQHAVTSFVATAGGGTAPAPPQTPAPAPQPATPASLPAADTTTAPATAPGSGPGQAPQHTPDPARPTHVPLPELPLPENVTPGIPGEPLNGGGPSSTLPLPSTAPVQVPGIHP